MAADRTELMHVEHVLDALNCGAALVARDGLIAHVNPRLAAMIGAGAARVVGRNVREFYVADADRGLIDKLLGESDQVSDQAREIEFIVPRHDGGRLPVHLSVRPLPAPLERLLVIIVIDISHLKRAEISLREDMRLLSQVGDNALEHALELKDYSEELEEKVRERTEDLRAANLDAIYMLAIASEAKDADTGRHVRRIQWFAETLARRMGIADDEAHAIGYSAILHDVGKIHVPDDILKKPGPLGDEERFIMKQHTLFGERILSKRPFFERARRIARSHHENWDGTGYPDGLAGKQIPLEARIVRVVDVYDALTTPRVYKPAWMAKQAVEFIRESSGHLFDRAAARVFCEMADKGEVESLVQRIEAAEEL